MKSRLALAVLLVCPSIALGQLVVGVDDTFDNGVYLIDVSDGSSSTLFTGIEIWGMTADDANRYLYSVRGEQLYRTPYDSPVPVNLGAIQEAGANRSMVSLAFNPSNGLLYGTRAVANDGVYEIDTITREATLVFDYSDPNYDFGGIAFDDATGKLYGVNDDADAFGGRGLYEINITSQTISFIVSYPGGLTDVDGLAIGNGRAYFVIDEPGSIRVFDLATQQFLPSLPSPVQFAWTYSGAAWAPGLLGGGGCVGDTDGDNDVDLTDLALLLSNFDAAPPGPHVGDVDGDGDVDLTDLALLLSNFEGECL